MSDSERPGPSSEIDRVCETLIVGAGPAGLAVAGRMRKLGLDFEIIEQSALVGTSWRNHYERLCLHTARDLSHLPHLPFPDDYPQYVTRQQMVDYLQGYADHFELRPTFNQRVVSAEKGSVGWVTTTESGARLNSQNLVIATGFNLLPTIPEWPGMEGFRGKLIHSRDYRCGRDFIGQKVLVIGMGNTGAELALDLLEQGASPTIAVRGPVNIVRRDFRGKPTQYTAIKLQKLPSWLNDLVSTVIQRITIGDLSRWGIEQPKISPSRQLREQGKTPVIDLGTVDHIKRGDIAIAGAVESFDGDFVCFSDNKREAFDAVVLATGYRSAVQDILGSTEGVFNRLGEPKAPVLDELPGLYFVGFNAYGGGILRSIYQDSALIARHIGERSGETRFPADQP